jgi:dTDP-4-dehydrorhamnose 3,5-epimerase
MHSTLAPAWIRQTCIKICLSACALASGNPNTYASGSNIRRNLIMPANSVPLPGVVPVEFQLIRDDRGFFYESFNAAAFERVTGAKACFVQDNHSFSKRGVLRGLHYQIRQAQGKLIQVISGEIYDVAVDLRRSAPTFGQWTARTLRAAQRQAIWIPPGFAHGFLVLSDDAEITYKVTDYWAPQHERKIIWNDPDLAIDWPLAGEPVLSAPDLAAPRFRDAEYFS